MCFKKHIDSHGNYYEFSEIKNSIPTILIHGVGLDNTMWYPQKEYFGDKSVLFYDLLNHGQSCGGFKVLSFEIYINQLLNIINELNLSKINIVGFSVGALIAQHFTEKYYEKVNKLVLIVSVYKRSSKQIETDKKRYSEAHNGSRKTNNSMKRWYSKRYLKNKTKENNFY